jgi:hypothetical protein
MAIAGFGPPPLAAYVFVPPRLLDLGGRPPLGTSAPGSMG